MLRRPLSRIGGSGVESSDQGKIERIVSVTALTKTLAMGDAYTVQQCTHADTAQIITLPLNASVPFNIGTIIKFERLGAGNLILLAAVGVTINGVSGSVIDVAQYRSGYIRKTGTNAWIAFGTDWATVEADSLTGLSVWLNPRTFAGFTFSSGSDISDQVNYGTNGVGNAVQATGSAQPLYDAAGINGYPAVQYYDDDTAKHLAIADHAGLDFLSTGMAFFSVLRWETDLGVSAVHGKFSSAGNIREFMSRISSADKHVTFYSTNGTLEASTTTTESIVLDTPVILSGYWDPVTDVVGSRTNLNAEATTAAVTALYQGVSPYYIGSRDSGGNPLAGWLGDVIFYNRMLSLAERNMLIQALGVKYAITV